MKMDDTGLVSGKGVRVLDEKEVRQMCQDYLDGVSISSLAEKYKISNVTVYGILADCGIKVRNRRPKSCRWTESQRYYLKKLYESGFSPSQIARQLGKSYSSVYFQLRTLGIKRRSHSEACRGFAINDHWFKEIDSEYKAYWLGFIAADGCLAHGHTLQIAIKEEDGALLEDLRKRLGIVTPLRYRAKRAWLTVSSELLAADLRSHGITERKSLKLRWPEPLREDLAPHFLRGYIDGDGSWTVYNSSGKKHYFLHIYGTQQFLEGCRDLLARSCDTSKPTIRKNRSNERIYCLTYGGRKQLSRIWHFLYDEAHIFLERKRSVFVDFVDP